MTFSQKIQTACQAKEELIDQHFVRYAVKSIFAGAFLTLSTGSVALPLMLSIRFIPASVASSFLSSLASAWSIFSF